ncbi:UbiA family prenyltransferase [Patescibacteria group bacterium]|nr:UbiA family prenyltransferase [Patescibacteria group bacterium]
MEILKLRAWKFILFERFIWLLNPIFYIVLVKKIFSLGFIPDFFILVASIFFFFSFSVLINDYIDMPYDIKVKKKRVVHKLPKFHIFILLIFTFILCLITAFLIGKFYSILYFIGFILAIFYSVFPIRLKERGFLGILTDVIIELIPVLFIFSVFSYFGFDAIVFILFYLFVQITSMIEHQIKDYDSDLKTHTNTFTVEKGLKVANRLVGIFSMVSAGLLFILFYFYLKIEYVYLILPIWLSRFVLPNSVLKENIASFKVPFYFADLVYVSFFHILTLLLSFLLTLKFLPYLSILFFTLFCDLHFIKGSITARIRGLI